MTDQTIIDKIRKLLALSTSSNVNEASLAWAKAQKLLLDYNLSMDQINTERGTKRNYVREDVHMGNRSVWRATAAYTVCRHNLCDLVRISGTDKVAIIGEKHNIELCRLMIETIIEQLQTLASNAYKLSGSRMHAITWKDAFYMGAIQTIDERLKQERAAASNSIRALIVVRDKELEQAKHHLFEGQFQAGKPKYTRSYDGYSAGRAAGHQVRFRKEID